VTFSKVFAATVLLLVCFNLPATARSNFEPIRSNTDKSSSDEFPLITPDIRRHTMVHNAGDFYTPIYDGIYSWYSTSHDPETGEPLFFTSYPRGSKLAYLYWGSLWVGGIVDQDTLVSTGFDGWFMINELPSEEPVLGSGYRTGHYADDEFITVLSDTVSDIQNPFGHQPLGLEIIQKSYSWADTVYDDFVIVDYTIKNIGGNYIEDGFIGFYMDCDIFHESLQIASYIDDLCGLIDTVLYAEDSGSRKLIPYAFDNDGDPWYDGQWYDRSIKGVFALMMLDTSFPPDQVGFNWWISNRLPGLDWGPRRLGTPENPLRYFDAGNLGTPVIDRDKYYMMSQSEIDYDQIETAFYDTSDSWILTPEGKAVDYANGHDTRFLYSLGPFGLPPGDSITFAITLVADDNLHINPLDWEDYFDPYQPQQFREKLDFNELLLHCRRADSVYKSGYTLPRPGPPVGLHLVEYDDDFISAAWNASRRPDLAGYFIYVKDTSYSPMWNRIPGLKTVTTGTLEVFQPGHEYQIAVTTVDTLGRESLLSFPIAVVPARPHPPGDLIVSVEGAIPMLSWNPGEDTAFQVFMIYRAIWDDPFQLYDSTSALTYADYEAESGVKYHYRVSAVNGFDLESEWSESQAALPMAFDRGLMLYNLNCYHIWEAPFYRRMYFDRLYECLASITPLTFLESDDSLVSFKTLSHYRPIIMDASNVPRVTGLEEDSLANYLAGGGRLVLIKPAFKNVGVRKIIAEYGEGDFYYDYLKLDSSVTNAFVIQGSVVLGDLIACDPLDQDYPRLEADPFKQEGSDLPILGYIPLAGYMYPSTEAQSIYNYVSSYPDTVQDGAVNGIRVLGDDYACVLFAFPLLAMKEPASFIALKQSLTDLGLDMNCGDADGDIRITMADIVILIDYLYRSGPEPPDAFHADVNGSGEVDTGDVLTLINYYFRGGHLNCDLQ